MIISEFGGSTVCLAFWVLGIVISLVLGMKSNDAKKSPRNGLANALIPSSFRSISSYLRVVSSGASTVVRSAASVASSFVDRDGDSSHDQVIWAGFDILEAEGVIHRRVLLLGYRSGFQVWDVEEVDSVRNLVSKHDVAVSFLQMLPHPSFLKKMEDNFAKNRPLLVVCAESSGNNNFHDGFTTHSNEQILRIADQGKGSLPTLVRFYSLKSHSYVHELKFRAAVYSVRCSSRVVAILQAAQIHCFDAMALERIYTAVTNPIVSGGLGFGPLAVGPRWVAYSGSPILEPSSGRVLPKQFTTSASFSGFASNGSLVAHYAKESSKHLAAGIVTLGGMGRKKLSRYYSDIRPDNGTLPTGVYARKGFGAANSYRHMQQDEDSVGMVIIRDIVSKSVVSQFRAHRSPISALCFDPSGTLLVTASVQGHNINVFKIMPGNYGSSDMNKSYLHLYQLQRGLTNAVICDISFSEDSRWIMISSSRGTSHLFAINPEGGSVDFQTNAQQMLDEESQSVVGSPVTLSAICRIRNGHSGWRGTVTGAAAAATGRFNFPSGAIASTFHNCNGGGGQNSKSNFHLLVFSPIGSLIQYALRVPNGLEHEAVIAGMGNAYDSVSECDGKLSVEAIQKWNVCQKQNRAECEESFDVYGDQYHGNLDGKKIYPERNLILSAVKDTAGSRARSGSDEKHHLFYISKAELSMHQELPPIWAKPGIHFQSMNSTGVEEEEEEFDSGGEIQIERIPTRTLEVRSKDLVPVFEYLRSPNNQTPRASNWSSSGAGNHHALHNKFGFSEKSNLFSGNAIGLDSVKKPVLASAKLSNGIEDTTFDGGLVPEQTNQNDFLHYNATTIVHTEEERLHHSDVNTGGSSNLEDPLKTLYSNRQDDLRMETLFEDKDIEFG